MSNFRLPLSTRRRLAANKRARYWRDPDFRLACINREREKTGIPPLDKVEAGPMVARDERGRFRRG